MSHILGCQGTETQSPSPFKCTAKQYSDTALPALLAAAASPQNSVHLCHSKCLNPRTSTAPPGSWAGAAACSRAQCQ